MCLNAGLSAGTNRVTNTWRNSAGPALADALSVFSSRRPLSLWKDPVCVPDGEKWTVGQMEWIDEEKWTHGQIDTGQMDRDRGQMDT